MKSKIIFLLEKKFYVIIKKKDIGGLIQMIDWRTLVIWGGLAVVALKYLVEWRRMKKNGKGGEDDD